LNITELENNIEIADYKVGDFPGDFEMWRK